MSWCPHPYLTEIFGDPFLKTVPTITAINGCTDYLDRVKPSDFKDTCFVKGLDQFHRHFVSFGVEIKDRDNTVVSHSIYTLFRRYTDTNSIWVMCQSHYSEDRKDHFNNMLRYSMQVTNEAQLILEILLCDFETRKCGLMLPCERFNHNTKEYDKIIYNVAFYCPAKTAMEQVAVVEQAAAVEAIVEQPKAATVNNDAEAVNDKAEAVNDEAEAVVKQADSL